MTSMLSISVHATWVPVLLSGQPQPSPGMTELEDRELGGMHSLSCELVGPHRDAIDKLHGAPQSVEFDTFVHMHDAIGGWRAPPDGILQVAPNSGQDDFEHGQATAEPLLGQQVTFPSDGNLLGQEGYLNITTTSEIPSAPPPLGSPNIESACASHIYNLFTGTGTLPRAGH